MRRLVLVLALLLVLVAPTAAQAQTVSPVDKAVAAFRKGESVYIDPSAELSARVSAADAAAMRARIKKGKRAVFVAVLPGSAVQEAGGNPAALPGLLHRRLGFVGTYAALAGTSFRAGNWDVKAIDAAQMATDAFKDKRDEGVGPVLTTFVDRVEKGSGGSKTAALLVALVAILALTGAVLYVLRRPPREKIPPPA